MIIGMSENSFCKAFRLNFYLNILGCAEKTVPYVFKSNIYVVFGDYDQ